jgi:hypothetical protein
MPGPDATDEQLLVARDAASFELFYVRHVDAMLGFFARRTFDAEIAADMRAETFAAALASRRRFSPGGPPARAWLFGIGAKMLPTPSGAATPTCARGGGSAWSESSSPTRTSPASSGSARVTRRAPSWNSCPPSSARRSPRT